MTALRSMRGASIATVAALMVAACSGGFGGSSPTPPASAESSAPASAPAEASASAAAEPVTLTFYTDDNAVTTARIAGLIDAYTALHPEVTIEVETHPGGTEGDNLVKTRLATGEMTDIFYYNSGSLLQALNPSETLVDISGEPFIANIVESYLPTVSAGDAIFGVPTEGSLGGGILYNKKIYADLGLDVPKTWAEFAANNEAIKAAGIAPVGATFGDTWTSQLFVLANNYNVLAEVPDFADQYTANEAHYSDTPAALAGFKRLQEAFEKEWWQEDFGADKFEDGLEMLATGEIAHYPMLTFARRHDRGELPRPARGRRLLRPAGRRRREERRDDLDARGHLHPQDQLEHRRGQAVPRLHRVRRGDRGDDCRRRAVGSVHDQGFVAAGRRPRGDQGHPGLHRRGPVAPGARVPLPDQGSRARADHGGGRFRSQHRRGGRRAVRPGRREAGRTAGTSRLVSVGGPPPKGAQRGGRSARTGPRCCGPPGLA